MSKLRSLNTAFWSDPFIEELKPDEKLLFLYLITNEKTNMLGIYENSVRKISFETGIETKRVETILKRFEAIGKIKYMDNWVMLVNFMKHQNYNPNMKKSAIDCYCNLPEGLKVKGLNLNRETPVEAFETLSKAFGMVRKVEVETEIEKEDESELEVEEEKKRKFEERKLKFASTLKPFMSIYGKEMLKKFYNYWTEPTKSNLKFKQELEKTWSLERRLETWANNEKKFNPPSSGRTPLTTMQHNIELSKQMGILKEKTYYEPIQIQITNEQD